MLNLYFKPTCPFSKRVLGEAEAIGVSFNLKDISADETLREELIEKGGKKQTPYLEDTERGVSMYESGDIVAYLNEHYASGEARVFSGLRVHKNDASCDVCEQDMYVKVRALPNGKKEQVKRIDEKVFEIMVREPAERNLANRRIIELLAREYGVATNRVRLISGHRSHGKMFDIEL